MWGDISNVDISTEPSLNRARMSDGFIDNGLSVDIMSNPFDPSINEETGPDSGPLSPNAF